MEAPNTKPYQLPADAVWFITGCSSGIGKALAQLAGETSNRVVATARNTAALADIPDGPNFLKLQLDVTSIPSIEAALDATVEKWGRVDVIVNNAGYSLAGDTEAAGDQESRAVMDTNFWGMVDVTKKAIGIMRDQNPKTGQQGGVIMNVSSIGGWAGFAGQSFYHASKFAMEGWTEAVAKELPSSWNIHLSIIEPGGVKTNYATSSMKMMETRHPAYAAPTTPTNALLGYIRTEEARKHFVEPRDVAAVMYKIASRGSRLPVRLTLGHDAHSLFVADLESVRRELEEFKDITLSLGNTEQSDEFAFLKS